MHTRTRISRRSYARVCAYTHTIVSMDTAAVVKCCALIVGPCCFFFLAVGGGLNTQTDARRSRRVQHPGTLCGGRGHGARSWMTYADSHQQVRWTGGGSLPHAPGPVGVLYGAIATSTGGDRKPLRCHTSLWCAVFPQRGADTPLCVVYGVMT